MKGLVGYVPPPYIPMGQSEQEPKAVPEEPNNNEQLQISYEPVLWSSGICACFDDTQSCCIGLFCPCYLFAKNAEFLGSESLIGPCLTHCMLWALVNGACCLLTDGLLSVIPACFISCYAYNYRKRLRIKYNLQEAPCGDLVTHFCCHQCALCQEYREICERSADPNHANLRLPVVTAPPVQKMETEMTPGK